MSNTLFSTAILAGGNSSRMGQNKALLEYSNETMISRLVNSFRDSSEIIISAASKGLYEREGARVVYDENHDIGPIEGIRQVLKASTNDYVFVCAVDMPFVNIDIARYLAEFISSDYDCYVIRDEEHLHPLCAIYSKKILPVIEELIAEGKLRLRALLDRVRTRYISLEYTVFEKKILLNINTKDEYIRSIMPVVFAVSGYKDSGKTWLISELINEFIDDGFKVGVIKHDGHDLILRGDRTDTDKFYEKGAIITAVYSESEYLINHMAKTDHAKLAELFKRERDDLDLIIIEGAKHSSVPKIVLTKDGKLPEGVDPDSVILSMISDPSSGTLLNPDDIRKAYEAVKEFYGL